MHYLYAHKRLVLILTTVVVLALGVLFYALTAFGVTRTWDGGGTDGTCGGAGTAANWSCVYNWSSDTAPTASDVAQFDGTCVTNCNPTINANISIAGLYMASTTSATITQASGVTITVGSSHWIQEAGNFQGGNSTIDVNGTFNLLGGNCTSTSGVLEVGRNYCANETILTVATSSALYHNSGTIKFVEMCSNYSGSMTATIDVAATLTLNNVETAVRGGNNGWAILTTAPGDSIVIAGSFMHTSGRLDGTWEVTGDVTVGSEADSGSGTLTYTAPGTHTYAHTGSGSAAHLRVNNASANVVAASSTNTLKVGQFSLLAGTFTAPTSTMEVGKMGGDVTSFTVATSSIFHHNDGIMRFEQDCGNYGCVITATIDVATTLTLHTVETLVNGGNEGWGTLTTAPGDTIVVVEDFYHSNGKLNGTWEMQGNIVVGSGADGGTATLTFVSSSDQTYLDQGGNEPDGDITINKPSGSITLLSNADWNAAGQDLTITSGTFDQGTSYNLATGAVTVGASGIWRNTGTGDITLGGNVANSGTTTLRGANICGGPDVIAIQSSVSGTQRSWAGTGIFNVFYDVTVKDQGGTAPINLISSTQQTNVGANWSFGGECPVPPPVMQIKGGTFQLKGGTMQIN